MRDGFRLGIGLLTIFKGGGYRYGDGLRAAVS